MNLKWFNSKFKIKNALDHRVISTYFEKDSFNRLKVIISFFFPRHKNNNNKNNKNKKKNKNSSDNKKNKKSNNTGFRGRHRMLTKCGHVMCDVCLDDVINKYKSIPGMTQPLFSFILVLSNKNILKIFILFKKN